MDLATVPVVIMTGFPATESAMAAGQLGVLDYVVIPIFDDDLLRISRLSDANRSRAPPPTRSLVRSSGATRYPHENPISRLVSVGVLRLPRHPLQRSARDC